MSGSEGTPADQASSSASREARPNCKRPVETSWPDGHHPSKSAKTDDNQIAPQLPDPMDNEQNDEAFQSQRNLLNVLTGILGRKSRTMPAMSALNDANERSASSSESGEGSDLFYPAYSSAQGSTSRESTPRPNPAITGYPYMRQPSFDELLRYGRETSAEAGVDTPRTGQAPFLTTPFTFTSYLADSSAHSGNANPASLENGGAREVRTKGKGKGVSAFAEDSNFSLPPWPSRPLPTPQGGIPSSSTRPVGDDGPSSSKAETPLGPFPQTPNAQNYPPSQSEQADNLVSNSFSSVMSFFSAGMNQLLSSVNQSNESSRKFISGELNAFRGELDALRCATRQQAEESLPLSEVKLSDRLTVPTRPRRRARARPHFVPTSSDEPSPDIRNKDREVHNKFMDAIRRHSLSLLGIKDYKYLGRIKCTLTEEEHEAFNLEVPGCPQVSAAEFLVDCAHPRNSPFNTRAISIFAEDFIDKVKNHAWYSNASIPERYLEPAVIQSAYRAHFNHIKSCYRDFVRAPQEDREKAKEARNHKLQKGSRFGRKSRLLKARLEAMVEHPVLKKHVPLVKYLGAQAISSDESEDEHRRTISYPRVYPRWRSPQLAALLWQADIARELDESIPVGGRKKAGTQFRLRPHSQNFNDNAPAPIGLPRNCYDSQWLSGLTERRRKELRAQEVDYDFSMVQSGSARDEGTQQTSESSTARGNEAGGMGTSHESNEVDKEMNTSD